MTGCAYSHRAWVREPATLVYPVGEIMVTEQAPQPRRVIVDMPPDAAHVWVAGYWTQSNSRWVWIPGHWEAHPKPGAA
jgi:hypothetical protein